MKLIGSLLLAAGFLAGAFVSVAQVEAVAAHVLDQVPFACPLEFSRGTQAVLDAIFAQRRG